MANHRRLGTGLLMLVCAAAAASCTPSGTPEDITTVRSAVFSDVVITVTDGAGAALYNFNVQAVKNDGSVQNSDKTNASGQVTLALPADSYRFMVDQHDALFYSGPAGHCVTPACTTASMTVNVVDVTVVDTSGTPQVDEMVFWEKSGGGTGGWVETGANGHAVIATNAASYRFGVSPHGYDFYSGSPGHCTVPSCTAVTITTTPAITVTVKDTNNVPIANESVGWENAQGNTDGWQDTNAAGVAILSAPPGTYRFEVNLDGNEYVSGPANHCTVPGCTSASITVSAPVTVTVVDTAGVPLSGKAVLWESDGDAGGSKNTNANGQATIRPPALPVRFRTTVDGTKFYSSATYDCTQPGCSTATILVSQPTVVTVLDGSGAAVSGKAVTPLSDEGITASNKTTNASGQATFRLPFGHWRFRATCSANSEQFFSGNAGHCLVSGCTTARIRMPCGQCTGQMNGTTCDDQTACSGTSTCQNQKCTGANLMNCSAGDACNEAGACSAETGACSGAPRPNGTSCNDNNACTQTDTCQSGTCTGGNEVTCTASDQCHAVGTCNPTTGACSNPAVANGTSCDDGSQCTQTDTCQSGACTGGNQVQCTASDQCHAAGTCDPSTGACSNPTVANGTSCNDSNACTQTDTCQSGACTGGNHVTCTPSDQCHAAGTCDPGTGACSNPTVANGTSCNDSDACTQTDTCQSGACTGGNHVTCTPSDQCHAAGTCNPSTGACSNPEVANGTSCNDGSLCTQTDTCQAGTCTGNPVTCSPSDQCHAAGTCDPSTGACSDPTLANGTSCSDGDSCTTSDTCQSGACTPGSNTCATIAITSHLGSAVQVRPRMTATLLADDYSVAMGDVVGFTASVTNAGTAINLAGDLTITNNGSQPFTIGAYQQTFEYQEVPTGVWTPFARVAWGTDGNLIPETTLEQLWYGVYVLGGHDVTYPPPSGNNNRGTGTVIDPGGVAALGLSHTEVLLPPEVVDIVFDPAQSTGLRAVTRIEMPSGPAQESVFPLGEIFAGATGDINDVTSDVHIRFVAYEPDHVYPLTSSETGPLPAGGMRIFTGTVAMPPITPFPLYPGEVEGTYVDRLYWAKNGYLAEVLFNGQSLPGAPPGAQSLVQIATEMPFIPYPLKSGPTAINAGLTGTYTLTMQNIGNEPAETLTITDSVDGQQVPISNLTLPATVPPHSAYPASLGAGSFKAVVPLERPVGQMTDVATLTWQDRNGNVFGPITARYTGNITAGHPEGYLSMDAAAGITDVIGQAKPFTVTALDPYGNPAPNVVVHFVVTGDNPQTADVTTGADGKVTFTYSGTVMGNDTVVASATITTTLITLDPVSVRWGTAVGTPCTGRQVPLDIVFVDDMSKSMVVNPGGLSSAGKLEAVRAATNRFIDGVNAPRDQMALVTFLGEATLDAQLGSTATAAKQALDLRVEFGIGCATNFCGEQGSNITGALTRALDELEGPRHRPDAQKVVVYIGDGGNDPFVDPTPTLTRLHNSGVRTIAIAIGSEINGAFIRQIASSPNDYYYSPSGAGVDFAFNNLNQNICRNLAPFVSAGGDLNAYNVRLPDVLSLQGEVHDDGPDGDTRLTSEWTVFSGPAPVAFANPNAPVTKALFTDPGTYVLQLAASDGYTTVVDRATITVDPEPNLTGGSLVLALGTPSPLTTGTPETITATLRDATLAPIGNFPVNLTIAGANPAQGVAITNAAGVATFTHIGKRAGTDQIQATALAMTFPLNSQVVTLTWNDPPVGGPLLTQGWIKSPIHQSTITGSVDVLLSDEITLTSGTLSYWPDAHPEQVHTLAAGLANKQPGSVLGTLDATLLANGSYIIALDGVDNANNQRLSEVLVTVTGDYKPGRVVVELTDFTVPIHGMPITIGRRYDSLEKDQVGDFGHGWSLMLGHPKLEVDQAFGVAMTMPNGRRVNFRFAPTLPVVGPVIIGFLLYPAYQPEPGVFGSLTANGCPVLSFNPYDDIPGPACFGALSLEGLQYAPTEYTYTDPYGTVYVMGATGELRSVRDRQGNSLTFQPNGIISSSGKSISFVRDAQGRITRILYPQFFGDYQDAAQYTYDAAGDLTSVQFANIFNVLPRITQHTYNQHLLLTTRDPQGNMARTSTYDADGRLATDTDAAGNVTHYTYNLGTRTHTTTTDPGTSSDTTDDVVVTEMFDARGLLLSETDPLGHTTTHEYDANRNETKKTNALGEETTATYDAFGNQTSLTDPIGTTSTTFNAMNLPVTSTDRLGHVTTTDYDDRGVPTRLADELGTQFKLTNSEQGLPIVLEDAAGKRAYIEYDAAGNVTGRTDWLGRITRATYDEAGHRLTETSARGGVTRYFYDLAGNLGFTRDASNYERSLGYDANNNYLGGYDNAGRQKSNTYNALNQLIEVRDYPNYPYSSTPATVTYTRDFRGNPLTMTDENGHTTTYEYDKAGQLKKTTFADGTFTTRTYDGLNRLASITNERGHTTTFGYDVGCGCSDRVTRVTDPLGHATVTAYDANGRRSSVTDANNHTTTFVYDVRNHVTETHYPDGTATYEAYDARGRRTSMTDQTGAVTLYGYDDQGQLTSVTDPLSNVTYYAYDLDGNLASVTDANNHTTSYEYDLLKRRTKRTLPVGQFETFAYSLPGDQIGHTDFRGKTTTMTYDNRSRLLTKVPDASLGEPAHAYAYSGTGKRLSSIDGSGTTTYTYDLRDRLLTKAATAGTLTYTYDATGNVATIRSSNTNGTSVDYVWNAANRLASITDNRVGGTTAATYTPTNRLATLAQPNGVGLTYSHDDPVGRLTSMVWRQGTSPAFASWVYSHNARGQRTTSTDITGRSAAYTYDNAARLTSETITGDPRGAMFNGALSYVLDGVGNRVSRTSTLAALGAQSYSYNANDEIGGDTYDANGNTITSAGHSYAYDFENRLISKDAGAVTVAYNCDGDRVSKTVGAVVTHYLVDDLNPTGYLQVLEEVVSGVVQKRFTYGRSIVSQTLNVSTTPATSYYGKDGHGNITFLTDVGGSVTDSYDYDAWGMLIARTGSTPNTRLYVGEELDPDLGLINLRARQYRPETGRFLTIDPAPGDTRQPLSLNRFVYASVDPINGSDPRGTMAILEYLNSATLGTRAVNLQFMGILEGVNYYAGQAGHYAAEKRMEHIWGIIEETAGHYGAAAAIAAALPGYAPVGVFGMGATTACILALETMAAFGGDPGEDGENIPLPVIFPCIEHNIYPSIQ